MHAWSPSKQQRIDSGTTATPSVRCCSPMGAMAIAAALLVFHTLGACWHVLNVISSDADVGTKLLGASMSSCSASHMQAVRARLYGGTAREEKCTAYRHGDDSAAAQTQSLAHVQVLQLVAHAAIPATKKTRCRRYYPAGGAECRF
jgi:hypothetical protein